MPHKTIPLRDYWFKLAEHPSERAKKMAKLCEKAGITYEHFKHVLNRRRRLGVDSAFSLVEASSKFAKQTGGVIDINDLILRKEQLRPLPGERRRA